MHITHTHTVLRALHEQPRQREIFFLFILYSTKMHDIYISLLYFVVGYTFIISNNRRLFVSNFVCCAPMVGYEYL